MMKKPVIVTAFAVLAAAVTSTAYAANGADANDMAEMRALLSAKLSVSDAVKAAEAAQPGRASEVSFDAEDGVTAYEVSVVSSDGAEHEVHIDANSGKVLKIVAEKKRDDEDGENDNDAESGAD